MSHIIGFRIDGLVGRKKLLNLKLNRDDNILFGLNGCGKTSLLKILHSAMSNELSLLHRVPFLAAEVDIYSNDYKKVFTRSITKPKSTPRVRRRVAQRRPRYEIQGQNEFMFSKTSEDEGLEWSLHTGQTQGCHINALAP
jgi:ATPase subunit of ABC transporter with duplicated ATPase domains